MRLRERTGAVRVLPFVRLTRRAVIYICIPAYNEAPTVGLLLWRLRSVLNELAREYEIVVFNDGSSDSTAETLHGYTEALPLTILGGPEHVGYPGAIDALMRAVSRMSRYPRRDAVITMQADFTDQPESLPELIKRFEGGADLVVAQSKLATAWPKNPRLLRRIAPFVTRPFVALPNIEDPYGTLRAYRLSVIRDLLKERGDARIVNADGWSANVELLVRAAKHARRVETTEIAPRYELRPRESRVKPWSGALSLYKSARTLKTVTAR